VRPLHDRRVGDAGRVAWLLIGAVGAFLSIACVNVTNLMLALPFGPPLGRASLDWRAWRSPRACCSP
jgi:hypothetical protein